MMCLACAFAGQAADEIVFTTVLENPITPVKNQNRSGTCWSYATIGYIEAELLRKTGKVYDLSEMFVGISRAYARQQPFLGGWLGRRCVRSH